MLQIVGSSGRKSNLRCDVGSELHGQVERPKLQRA